MKHNKYHIFSISNGIYLVGETEEERITAMKLAQDLRWCEIKVDIDTNNRSKDEQLKDTKSNFIIVVEKDCLHRLDLKFLNYLVKILYLLELSRCNGYGRKCFNCRT